MKAYLSALNLLVHAHLHPENAMTDGLGGILAPDMRKHAAATSALMDGAVSGDDIASSIAAVSLPDDCMPDESASPLWPLGTKR
ncbi:hypothetical protein J4G48_0048160 (plasmid) [Bradyrhizobium barranii subsp. apii]|uniref:hypothetical protein n=1 Tax=Bradyrhizobium barranii TaxID=2992140 RepID=UPI001AA192BA|nr:hypothetical protein [Bradyrhizobium barranii]UPU01449.1 hypothetical protein J4G48_0048160 [Bradyrhizobium barranii subsp. apii]